MANFWPIMSLALHFCEHIFCNIGERFQTSRHVAPVLNPRAPASERCSWVFCRDVHTKDDIPFSSGNNCTEVGVWCFLHRRHNIGQEKFLCFPQDCFISCLSGRSQTDLQGKMNIEVLGRRGYSRDCEAGWTYCQILSLRWWNEVNISGGHFPQSACPLKISKKKKSVLCPVLRPLQGTPVH